MKHGGDLSEAGRLFGAFEGEWLDLSTGINPVSYPFRAPDRTSWQALPQSADLERLLDAARSAYGAAPETAIVAAPGTQCLIQLLPIIRTASKVAILEPTYSEHAICWRQSGARIEALPDLSNVPERAEIAVAVNPNNPDGRVWPMETVLRCAAQMARRNGLLIVDEAFADTRPEMSVVPHMGRSDGLIVLRSFGKFFGLAGLRLGFAIGSDEMIAQIDRMLGPWAVSGPAIEIGAEALGDLAWQADMRQSLARWAVQLDQILSDAGFEIIGGTSLYRLTSHPSAQSIHRQLASRGIWVRRFEDKPDWLRFGVPGDAAAFERLAAALT